MAKEKREKKKKLTKMYRLNIVEDESHKTLFRFRANRISLILGVCASFLILLCLILILIAYTPVKQLIPGYPSPQTRREIVKNAIIIDSLETEIHKWALQLTNIQRVITGKEPIRIDSLLHAEDTRYGNTENFGDIHSKDDSLLRSEIMNREKYNLSTQSSSKIEQIEGLLFFPPVKGVITENYNKSIGHPYIDIASPANSIVSATLDGTIISAGWIDETGYTIQIQHSNNLVSIYKHNAKLLKKTGDKVTAGTPISLVGDTGKLSSGPHLHFELWHNGEPIDPAIYINF
jgi:murein DD-endopeptidase MepM/ murein hydrolase activator NlpD